LVTFEKEVEGASERSLALFVAKARRALRMRDGVNVMVTTNRQMRRLNKQFRGKDKPTDVLSFPAGDAPKNDVAGDIAISYQIAAENGRKLGHGTAVELKILVLHGVLHLAGHDHESDDGQMARKEQRLRRELGLPDGLIERTTSVARPKTSLAIGVPRLAQKRRETRNDNSGGDASGGSATGAGARKSARSGR
jgi:probable rRNA maturation factor